VRAVILAGGRGSRLAPFTTVIPKPLLPVGHTPILEIIIRQLSGAGFDHITLTLGYMSTYFHTFIEQHPALRRLAHIDFVEENQPTGTAGSLAAVGDLPNTFLVMNGDLLTSLDYRAIFTYHLEQRPLLTIGLHSKDVKIDLGVVKTDEVGQVTDYIEKPVLSYGVSMGVYIYDREALSFIQPGECVDFPTLVHRLLAAGKKVLTYPSDATWLDLGRYEDLQAASEIFLQRQHEFLPAAQQAA
jgi:NDP-sugar pyrophosphorylase family protein